MKASRLINSSLYIEMLVTAILVCFFVALQVNKSVKRYQENEVSQKLDLISHQLNQFIDTHFIVLQKIASKPLLVQAVMQPKENMGALTDYFHDMQVLGRRYDTVLVDFAGDLIYTNEETEQKDSSLEQWFSSLASKHQDLFVGTLLSATEPEWLLSVPVRYNGEFEGAILIKVPVYEYLSLSGIDVEQSYCKISFLTDDGNQSVFGRGEYESGISKQLSLSHFGLKINFTHNLDSFNRDRLIIIVHIGLIIIFIFIIASTVSRYYTKRLFIKPLLEIEKSAQTFGKTGEKIVINKKYAIDELGRLGETFNNMATSLRETMAREKKLASEAATANAERSRADELEAWSIELKMAKDQAESATYAKSQFLACMSHDIRTPLNTILGMLDLLSESPLNQDQKNYVKICQHSSDGFLNLIDDILDFSKIEAGHVKVDNIDFELRKTIMYFAEIIEVNAVKKGLKFVYHVNDDVPDALSGDKSHLLQIIMNLAGNAIKFTDKGEVKLQIENEPDSKESGILRFSISDTGIGIEREQQKTIFDIFTQADSTTTRKYDGTGLGLSICRRLVELMGGRIWVNSEPGKGSTFSFSIEFDRSVVSVNKISVTINNELKPGILPPLKILLVEDSEDNIFLVQTFLKKTPFEIVVARDGKEATEQFKASKFDIVLMDMQMPVMDGYTATNDIRTWERLNSWKHTTILALTANVLKKDQQKSIDAGCDGLLTKPIKKLKLLQAISEFAGDKKNVLL